MPETPREMRVCSQVLSWLEPLNICWIERPYVPIRGRSHLESNSPIQLRWQGPRREWAWLSAIRKPTGSLLFLVIVCVGDAIMST
jgi:hypothetical protein